MMIRKALIPCIICTLFMIHIFTSFNKNLKRNNSASVPLTLIESYKITLIEAKKWNKNAELCFLSSIDDDSIEIKSNGSNGKRMNWNFEFASMDSSYHLIITLKDGRIVGKDLVKSSTSQGQLILSNEIVEDSPNIILKSKHHFNLQPGIEWATGYHYVLEKKEEQPVLAVTGLDTNGYFSKIYFNSKTGDLISAEHKVPIGGGVFKDAEPMADPFKKPYGILGVKTSPKYLDDNIVLIWGVDAYGTYLSTPFFAYTNNGSSWEITYFHENIQQAFFSSNYSEDYTIYLSTLNSLYTYNIRTKNISMVYKSENPIKDLCVLNKQIYLLTDEGGISYLDNKSVLTKICTFKDAKYIKISPGNELFVLTNDGLLLKHEHNSWSKVDLKLARTIFDVKFLSETIIAYDSHNISIINKENNCNLIDVPEGIQKIFTNQNSYNNYIIYVYTNDNNFYGIREGGDKNSYTKEKIKKNDTGHLYDIAISPKNELYSATIPTLNWEIINRR